MLLKELMLNIEFIEIRLNLDAKKECNVKTNGLSDDPISNSFNTNLKYLR